MNLADTIIPKSDQLNADDLISGAITIKVTAIKKVEREGTKAFDVNYDGDNGKPYKPCKSMRRVIIASWGKDGSAYVGRSMTLYRDDSVTFGGIAVGGIRISHLSHIDRDLTLPLTVSRTSRKPYTVKRLEVAAPASDVAPLAAIKSAKTLDELASVWKSLTPTEKALPTVTAAKDDKKVELTPAKP